jgi:hypothetical protein
VRGRPGSARRPRRTAVWSLPAVIWVVPGYAEKRSRITTRRRHETVIRALMNGGFSAAAPTTETSNTNTAELGRLPRDRSPRYYAASRRTMSWAIANSSVLNVQPNTTESAKAGVRCRRRASRCDCTVYLAEHMGQVSARVVPCVQVDGDRKLSAENAAQYWSSIMRAARCHMLAARSRGLCTTAAL